MNKLRLCDKITLYFSGLLAVLGIFLLTTMILMFNQKLSDEFQKRGVSVAKTLAVTCSDLVKTEDFPGLLMTLYEYKNSEQDVEYIFISDTENKVIAHTLKEGFPAELNNFNILDPRQQSNIQSISLNKERVLDIAVPVMGQAGILHLGIPAKPGRKDISYFLIKVGLIIIILFPVGFVASAIISRLLTKPMRDFTSTVQASDFKEKILLSGSDEIGELGIAFNEMVDNIKDITASRDYMGNIIRSIPNSLITIDNEGIIESVNKATLDLLGYNEKEILGKNVNVLFDEMIFPKKFDLNGEIFVSRYEANYLTKDKRKILVLLSGSAIMDTEGKLKEMILSVQDFSVTKKIVETIISCENRFRQLLGSMSEGVVVYQVKDAGQDFTVADINKAGELIVGANKSDIMDKSIIEICPNADECGLIDTLRKVFKTGKPERLKDALYKEISIFGWRKYYVYKQLTGEIVTIVEDQNDGMNISQNNEDLAKKPLDKDGFPAGVHLAVESARDFSNVLSLIMGYTDLSMGGLDRNSTIYENLKEIKIASHTAVEIMNQSPLEGQVADIDNISLDNSAKDANDFDNKIAGENIEYNGGGKRILLVESENELVKCWKRILKRYGYVIYHASSKTEAIVTFNKENCIFDLLLVDSLLKDFTGIELVKVIKYISHDIPVLMMSSYIDEESQLSEIKENGYKCLKKPFSNAELLSAISEVIATKQLSQD